MGWARAARVGAAAFALVVCAGRDSAAVVHPDDPVAGHPGVTYLDLVRQAVPSLALNAADNQIEGHLDRPPRHLAGRTYEGPEPDPVVLSFMEDERIRVGGRPRIAMIVDFGPEPDRVQSATQLMLFDDAPTPRLLDAAAVSVDKDTEFYDPARLRLGLGDDALIAHSEHDDADISFGGFLLVSAVGDRLRLIGDFFTTSARACGWSEIETPTFTTAPDPGHPFWRIDVTMRTLFSRTNPDCGATEIPRAHSRTFRASFRWNAARGRFATQGDGLRGLAALNRVVFH
jgi:hypothetical protein